MLVPLLQPPLSLLLTLQGLAHAQLENGQQLSVMWSTWG